MEKNFKEEWKVINGKVHVTHWQQFDKDGNVVEEQWYDFDENGRIVYQKMGGYERWYEWDENGKLKDTVQNPISVE